jgi:hypothetical protein
VYPRDLIKQLRRRLAEGVTLDEVLLELRADGASIMDCIKAVKNFRGCDVAEAKRMVNDSSAWKDVVERTWCEIEIEIGTRVMFISNGEKEDRLAGTAKKIFELLGILKTEERFSSNYPPDEHYFAGYAENIELTVWDCDSNQMPEYPFRVSISKATWRKGPNILVEDERKIAQILANSGFKVFVPTGAWARADWDGEGDVYIGRQI